MNSIREFVNSDAQLVWVDEGFLEREGVRPDELPLWAPEDSDRGHVLLDGTRAFLEGFEPRRLEDSLHELDDPSAGKLRMSRQRERSILDRWSASANPHAFALRSDREI